MGPGNTLKGWYIPARGETPGNGCERELALKGRDIKVRVYKKCIALSGLEQVLPTTQGVTLGWYVTALRAYFSAYGGLGSNLDL